MGWRRDIYGKVTERETNEHSRLLGTASVLRFTSTFLVFSLSLDKLHSNATVCRRRPLARQQSVPRNTPKDTQIM